MAFRYKSLHNHPYRTFISAEYDFSLISSRANLPFIPQKGSSIRLHLTYVENSRKPRATRIAFRAIVPVVKAHTSIWEKKHSFYPSVLNLETAAGKIIRVTIPSLRMSSLRRHSYESSGNKGRKLTIALSQSRSHTARVRFALAISQEKLCQQC